MKLPSPAVRRFTAERGNANIRLHPEKFLLKRFRTRVQLPPAPPMGDQANPAAIYFVGAVFVLAMPLPIKRR